MPPLIDDLLGEDGAIALWNAEPGAGAGQRQDHADLDGFTKLLRVDRALSTHRRQQ
jgi:hypothetical protein